MTLIAAFLVLARQFDPNASGWSQFGIAVAAVLAASVLIEFVRRWWLWLHRPELAVRCSDTKEFNKSVVKQHPIYEVFAEGRTTVAHHAKFLRVDETHGNAATNVRASLNVLDEDDPPHQLRWWTGDFAADLLPHSHSYLSLQHILIYEDGFSTVTPMSFGHRSPVRMELTLYVADKRYATFPLEIELGWPGLALDMALNRDEGIAVAEVLPDPFYYPSVKVLS